MDALAQTAKLYLRGRNPRCLSEAQIAELRDVIPA